MRWAHSDGGSNRRKAKRLLIRNQENAPSRHVRTKYPDMDRCIIEIELSLSVKSQPPSRTKADFHPNQDLQLSYEFFSRFTRIYKGC